MMQKLNDRLRREDAGFTLIELMVVVLIIAILIAIAIPTFLGARGRAQDRAAQSALRNTVTGAKAIFTDNEDYGEADETALTSAEPSLQFVAAATGSQDPPNEVSVDPRPTGQPAAPAKSKVFIAAARSANGDHCWFIMDRVNPEDNPGTWWALRDLAGATDCNADAAPSHANDADYTGGDDGDWTQEPGDAATP